MLRRMLVPLDGTRSSSSVVPYAAELANSLGCRVDLLLVEEERGGWLPHPEHHQPRTRSGGESGALVVGTSTPVGAREAYESYLARHVEEFEALGIETNSHVRRGKPVDEILRAALDLRCDIIAMATRHRGQFARPDAGSVAEEVVWRSRLPVLLVAEG